MHDRRVNGNAHDTTTVPPSTASRDDSAPAFSPDRTRPPRGPLVRATCRCRGYRAPGRYRRYRDCSGSKPRHRSTSAPVSTAGNRSPMKSSDGLAIVQGDIILGTPEELEPRDRQPAGNAVADGNPARLSDRAKLPTPVTTRDSAANTDPNTRWPDGVVAYVIDEDLYLPTRVHDAIEHWEEHTSIRFVERTDESNWVNFMKPDQREVFAPQRSAWLAASRTSLLPTDAASLPQFTKSVTRWGCGMSRSVKIGTAM